MALLNIQHTEAIEARDRLQFVVDEFKQCSEEYETTLNDKTLLKQQLHEANSQISELEILNLNITAGLNNSLFSELVSAQASQLQYSDVNLDLNPLTSNQTTDNDACHPVKFVSSSHKKLKKYIRISKFITKTNRLVKRQKFFIKNVKLNRERFQLLKQLSLYSSKLNQSARKYETDTQSLQSELEQLTSKLEIMSNKYSASERQMREYMLAMNELVSSQEKQCEKCTPDAILPALSVPACETTLPHGKGLLFNNCNPSNHNIGIFSDEIGKNLGSMLTNELPGQSTFNHCMPGCSFGNILDKINKYRFNPDSTLIIMCGNRGSLNKKSLINFHNSLAKLNLKQIIIFALPYIKSLPQEENNSRYKINTTLYNLSINTNIHFIDTNNYVGLNIYRTKDRYYLSKYYLRQIAMSLSYFFNISANNLAKQVTPIEQPKNIDIHNESPNIYN
ncbi:unnamed protein product [Spodoptera exigua]|nr:unnamed protein product [Spodoptera exigua]